MPNSLITSTNNSGTSQSLSQSDDATPATQAAPATSFDPFGLKNSTSTMQLIRTTTDLSQQPATQPHEANDSQATQVLSPLFLVRQDAFLHR
jgi:hypothetical protein